jgi:hypothetical protein
MHCPDLGSKEGPAHPDGRLMVPAGGPKVASSGSRGVAQRQAGRTMGCPVPATRAKPGDGVLCTHSAMPGIEGPDGCAVIGNANIDAPRWPPPRGKQAGAPRTAYHLPVRLLMRASRNLGKGRWHDKDCSAHYSHLRFP